MLRYLPIIVGPIVSGWMLCAPQQPHAADGLPEGTASGSITCPVQRLHRDGAADRGETNGARESARSLLPGEIDRYWRDPQGEWPRDDSADPDSPAQWVKLQTPQGPILLALQIFVDGKPFRQARAARVQRICSRVGRIASSAAEVAGVEPPARRALDSQHLIEPVEERVQHYFGRHAEVDADEVHWLLAEWTPGFTAMWLAPGQYQERAALAPLWNAFDADHNQAISAREIDEARDQWVKFDANRDGVLELSEFAAGNRTTDGTRHRPPFWSADELCEPVPSNRPEAGLPSLELHVELGAPAQGEPRLELLAMSASLGEIHQVAQCVSGTIVVSLESCYLEISAWDPGVADPSALASDQVSIGAVVDGYPLLRLADRDADRRISRAEARDILTWLPSCDRNRDGQISCHEISVPIRVAICRGPHVHEVLAQPTSAPHRHVPTEGPHVPEWFAAMDHNRDRELSRTEFLGTDAQFQQYDQDRDGNIQLVESQLNAP